MRLNFKELSGDVDWLSYGAKWVSKRLNNGDFDYWFVLEFTNLEDIDPSATPPRYMVTLSAVSPSEAKEHLASAFECCGYNEQSFKKEFLESDMAKVEALSSYGVSALLWSKLGNNARELLKKAREEAFMIETLFGFYMDRAENMIGNDGWDFIRGDIGFK